MFTHSEPIENFFKGSITAIPSNGIDKLELEYYSPIHRNLFNDLKSQYKKWNGGTYKILFENYEAEYKYARSGVKLILNPNRFPSLTFLSDWIARLIQAPSDYGIIRRIDLNIDLPLPFLEVCKRTDVPFKRKGETFCVSHDSGRIGGQYFGASNSPSRVCIYDKSADHNDFPASRIELRLTKSAVPSKVLKDLKEKLLATEFTPFNAVRFIESVRTQGEMDTNQIMKCTVFETKLDCLGFSQAKKQESVGGHFLRKYKGIYDFQVLDIPLNDMWRKEVEPFLTQNIKVETRATTSFDPIQITKLIPKEKTVSSGTRSANPN